MNQTNHVLAALAQAPDPALAAETCRIFIRSMLFNEGEHVEWESLDAVLALALRAFGLGELEDLDPNLLGPLPTNAPLCGDSTDGQ